MIVLLVSVSVPAKEAKSASVTAVLNCAKVPLTVLDPKATVLFVRVSVVVLPTKVSVATGRVSTEVPAVAPDTTVVVPDVEPLNLTPVVPNVGSVANTREPDPVSSVIADAKLADEGVPKKVATPVPKLVSPVPPLAAAKVPAKVIAPVEELLPSQLNGNQRVSCD